MDDFSTTGGRAHICSLCGKPIGGLLVSDGDQGWMHEFCYAVTRPHTKYNTFDDVLGNIDDQAIVRELLKTHVPGNIKQYIVKLFNKHLNTRFTKMRENHESGKL